jgi:hypothetical protein
LGCEDLWSSRRSRVAAAVEKNYSLGAGIRELMLTPVTKITRSEG